MQRRILLKKQYVCVCVGGGVSCFVNILGSLRMRYISMDSEKNINSINKNGGRWANAYRWAEYLYNIFFRIGVCVCALSVEPLQSMIIYLMRCFSFVCAFLFVCLFVCLPRFLFSQIEYCCLLACCCCYCLMLLTGRLSMSSTNVRHNMLWHCVLRNNSFHSMPFPPPSTAVITISQQSFENIFISL